MAGQNGYLPIISFFGSHIGYGCPQNLIYFDLTRIDWSVTFVIMAVTVHRFTSFVGLEEFTKEHEFKVAPIYAKDGKVGTPQTAWAVWLSDVIDINTYNDYNWVAREKNPSISLDKYEFTCEYYKKSCDQLKNVPNYKKEELFLDNISKGFTDTKTFMEHDEKLPLNLRLYEKCQCIFYNHSKKIFELRPYLSGSVIAELDAIEVTLGRKKSLSYRNEILENIIKKGFSFPYPYTCMQESVSHYLRGMLWYSKKSPVAKMYYYWLENYLVKRLIYHVMIKTAECSKSGKPYVPHIPGSCQDIDWDPIEKSAAVLFIEELTRIIPHLPTYRWQVATDYRDL